MITLNSGPIKDKHKKKKKKDFERKLGEETFEAAWNIIIMRYLCVFGLYNEGYPGL